MYPKIADLRVIADLNLSPCIYKFDSVYDHDFVIMHEYMIVLKSSMITWMPYGVRWAETDKYSFVYSQILCTLCFNEYKMHVIN